MIRSSSAAEIDRPLPSAKNIGPAQVHDVLKRHMLVDGYPFVLDLAASRGSWLVDAVTNDHYLDFFSFFASSPLGLNPPQLVEDPKFMSRLGAIAVNKPANPDVYTVEYARFVDTFTRVLGDPALPHLFFIDGGTLAVENALKAAFDWKARRRLRKGRAADVNLRVLHLDRAFHGRSGYTLSLTNTEPAKTELFPKFDWPRIPTTPTRFPLAANAEFNAAAERTALDAARAAFERADDDIACFIAETIQGEGGDNHLRAEFLRAIQDLCHQYDALFVLDEVQSGCGLTGTPWAYQQLGLEPDVVAFGKKTQVCGIMAGRRIDLVPENVFRVSSRISSTWGGNLADMVRATRLLEVMEQDDLFHAASVRGKQLLDGLVALARQYPALIDNPRGRGLMGAFDLKDGPTRDALIHALFTQERVIVLPCGQRGLRFRPALTVREDEINIVLRAVGRCLSSL